MAKLVEDPQTSNVGTQKKQASLPALTIDVLVHTWDLARALDVVVALDGQLCSSALSYVRQHIKSIRASGLFGDENVVRPDASVEARLVAILGRNPY